MNVATTVLCDQCGQREATTRYGWHRVCKQCRDAEHARRSSIASATCGGYVIIRVPLRMSVGMSFDPGEIVSVTTLCLFTDLSILGALRVLWKAARWGTLERVNTMEYRVIKPVRFLRTVKRRT